MNDMLWNILLGFAFGVWLDSCVWEHKTKNKVKTFTGIMTLAMLCAIILRLIEVTK